MIVFFLSSVDPSASNPIMTSRGGIGSSTGVMGIKPPFPSIVKACVGPKKIVKVIGSQSSLRETMGEVCVPVIGMDMSVSMMMAVRSDWEAEEYHQQPPHPAHHVALVILQLIRKLMRAGFGVLPGK